MNAIANVSEFDITMSGMACVHRYGLNYYDDDPYNFYFLL